MQVTLNKTLIHHRNIKELICGICNAKAPEHTFSWDSQELIKRQGDSKLYRCTLCTKCNKDYSEYAQLFFINANMEEMK